MIKTLKLHLLTVFFIGLTLPGFAQGVDSTAIILFRQLPDEGILLDKGWRIHLGDNPAWASRNIDDQPWPTVNPNQPPGRQPQVPRSGFCWLRLRFRLSDSLRQQPLTLSVDQRSASEVFLNGRLLRRFGTVSDRPEQLRPYGDNPEPIVVRFDEPGEQVLAVRMAIWPPITLFSENFNRILLRIQLRGVAQAIHTTQVRQASQMPYLVVAVVFLLLSLLHLAFYRYNPSQRANAYFAAFTLTGMLGFGCLFASFHTHDIRLGLAFFVLFYTLHQVGWMGALRALYSLFNFPIDFIYYSCWVCLLLGIPLFFFGPVGPLPYIITVGFIIAGQVRLTVLALIRHRRGAAIIAIGFGVTLLETTVIAVITLLGNSLSVEQFAIAFAIAFLSPVFSISVFLGREFALDSRLLQLKLAEVQQLSAQTLAQEQEKQSLLAAQNETLERQVEERTAELKQSIHHLRTTQTQLIQKEKMASLGELTAGIAHEIQNPLNFVNNFSEVSTELVNELEEEQHKAYRDPQLEKELLIDLKQNLQKITHHGGRASAIVRGMLEHSRPSSGQKRPTHLNTLVKEYLTIAYQGLRANNSDFSCELATDFAPTLGHVEIAPQDIGRVLLNLFNNAFYALSEKQKQQVNNRMASDYKPTIIVRTHHSDNQVIIYIKDNGTGIPDSVKAKVFQPFFTTKPTGEGTGLGLSLSYDIVTKGHNGEIRVESEIGQYTEFSIFLPLSPLSAGEYE